MIFKPNKPMELDDYVRQCRLRTFLIQSAAAVLLLLTVWAVGAAFPDAKKTVNAWVFGSNSLDAAVSAFYESVSGGQSATDALTAFCQTLDHEAS